jgi:hypothetical protein
MKPTLTFLIALLLAALDAAEFNLTSPRLLTGRFTGACVSGILRIQALTRSAPPGKLAE